MLNADAHLLETLFDETSLPHEATRDGFGRGVVAAGKRDERVIVLCADLAESTRAEWFKKEFPERYIEIGVAEQNLATVAAGLAVYGKIPFITSYAAFSPGRNNEQIRTTISLNNVPVKVCGMHAGISVGPDGATHQALEDVALMRVQPNMTVIVPCDAHEAQKATEAVALTNRPAYLRFGREKTPVFTTPQTPFQIGKLITLWHPGNAEVALFACGALVYPSLVAAKRLLEQENIRVAVYDNHSIKPMDIEGVIGAAREAGAVVTAEEHQILGGMGSTVAEILVQNHPVPMELIGVHDKFGQSGEANELYEHYGMGVMAITEALRKARSRKHS
jgi:transketolase